MSGSSKKLADRASMVPTSTVLIEAQAKAGQVGQAKTAPGQMMAFMAKESAALKENEALKAENQALKSTEISLDSISEVQGRRRILSPEKYAELVENLRNNPLATPLTVRSLGAGKFELISGHNRLHAFRDLGRTTIAAAVVDFDDVAAIKGAFYANLISDTLPDYEKFRGFKQIMAHTGQTQTEAAKDAGISASAMSQIMEFDKLPKEAIHLISKSPDAVSYSAIVKLKKLPGMLEGIKALVEAKATLVEAIAIASEIKEKPVAAKPVPLVIKNGRERVAEIMRRDGLVSVKFKDSSLASSLVVEIEKLIRAHIKE